MRMALSPWKILRTLALAATMTGIMTLARPLGALPAGLLGVVFFACGLFAARIVNIAELRSLRAERP
jgi:hypothetical protein